MAIEIKELHIKAVVVNDTHPISTQPQGGLTEVNAARLKREITDDVLRKVWQKLKQNRER